MGATFSLSHLYRIWKRHEEAVKFGSKIPSLNPEDKNKRQRRTIMMTKKNRNVHGAFFAVMMAGAFLTACGGQKTVGETMTVQTEQHEASNVSSAPTANAVNTSMQETENLIGMPNPFTDNETLEEAEKNAGFSIEVPEQIRGIAAASFRNLGQELVEVIYYDGDQEIARIRKGTALDDISGVYTDYKDIRNEQIDGRQVTLKGHDGQYELAIWQQDGFTYSLSMEPGGSEAVFVEMIRSIQ